MTQRERKKQLRQRSFIVLSPDLAGQGMTFRSLVDYFTHTLKVVGSRRETTGMKQQPQQTMSVIRHPGRL